MAEVLDAGSLAQLLVLGGFLLFVASLHTAAVVLAERERQRQLRRPRYWGR